MDYRGPTRRPLDDFQTPSIRIFIVTERTEAITCKGNPITLSGPEITTGQQAPNCTLVANDMSPVELNSYRGKIVIVSVVPSLDTPVCDIQTKRFNEEAGKLGDQAVVLTISMDLPMAQKRWCGAADAKHVVTLSDYKDRAFGAAFGLYIKELGLLARAVYVIDKDGIVKYAQLVGEVTREPDYDTALSAAKALL